MRFLGILAIIRLIVLIAFPLTVHAQTIQDTNTLQNENQNIIKITNSGVFSRGESSSVNLEDQNSDRTKLSILHKRILSYHSNVIDVVPSKGKTVIEITGYSSTVDQCDGDPFTTASGSRVHQGTMACPRQYPFGTKIKIDGVGTFVCEDRGGAIKNNRFDMWFESRQAALNWGRRLVEAEIVKQ